jgi:hypothetical protein
MYLSGTLNCPPPLESIHLIFSVALNNCECRRKAEPDRELRSVLESTRSPQSAHRYTPDLVRRSRMVSPAWEAPDHSTMIAATLWSHWKAAQP